MAGMCLLGIFADRALPFATCVRPSTFERLSGGLRDAWGATIYTRDRTWESGGHVGSAAGHALVASTSAEALAMVAQVYLRSVGDVALVRTPPFRRGRWVFAHSGTVDDIGFVRSRTSVERQRQCGETASEMLFAFLLTRLDERDLTERHAPEQVDDAIREAASEIASSLIGSSSFLLSDGDTLYVHRFGRPLHMLEERPTGVRPTVVLVASEPITGHAWTLLEQGTLLRCRRSSTLELRFLSGSDPREDFSDIELPFTD